MIMVLKDLCSWIVIILLKVIPCVWALTRPVQKASFVIKLSLGSMNPVNDTSQWQICAHFCHWPAVNDINACIFVIDCSQWQICAHICHWPQSMTNMHAYLSLTKVNDIYACIFVIDHSQWQLCMHLCHWPKTYFSLTTECDFDSVACIFVIDRPIRRCKKAWVSAYLSLTVVNDKYAWPLSVI